MPKPKRDDGLVNAVVQKLHRRAVSKNVRTHPLPDQWPTRLWGQSSVGKISHGKLENLEQDQADGSFEKCAFTYEMFDRITARNATKLCCLACRFEPMELGPHMCAGNISMLMLSARQLPS